jgi:hypothetical protein
MSKETPNNYLLVGNSVVENILYDIYEILETGPCRFSK